MALSTVSNAADCVGPPLARLRLSSELTAGWPDAVLSVQVHRDGCVAVHRPAHYRAAGDYHLQLPPAKTSALAQQVEHVRAIDSKRLRSALKMAIVDAPSMKSSDGSETVVEVSDRDWFELSVEQSGKWSGESWADLHTRAQMHTQLAELQTLSALAAEMQALANRVDGSAGASP